MSTEHNDGGSVYHVPDTLGRNGEVAYGSLDISLRDYFAAHETLADLDAEHPGPPIKACEAMAGYQRPKVNYNDDPMQWIKWEAAWRAGMRYIRADAMIAAGQRKAERREPQRNPETLHPAT